MKQTPHALLLCAGLLCLSLMQGCATRVKASSSYNPAPAQALNAYGRIELKTTVLKAGAVGNANGVNKIDENLQKELKASIASWNQVAANGRTLVIEPVVEQMQFQSGAKRVFLGPLAGSSGVLLRLTLRDGDGNIVASPEFFQRADAMAAGFLLGVHDNLMLTRVAMLASEYVKSNYDQARGGPTGADDKSVLAK